MALSINTNALSLNTQRSFATQDAKLSKVIERLSSGMRINRASDDAAGQAISERMSAGLRGASMATRSLSDATSMLQVAESAMSNVSDSLQRLREMAVASGNASYTDNDRRALQQEATQLLAHITKVGSETEFNGQAIFSQDTVSIGGDEKRRAVLDGLQSGWLSAAEDMIGKYYGITGDGVKLTINLADIDGPYNNLASVSGPNNLQMNLDMADFGNVTTPDGGSAPLYSDRIIAHEMVHAVMFRATDLTALPQWFIEGTAELINGADERVAGNGNHAGMVADIAGGGFSYEGSYVASRYLHDQLKNAGVEGGIKGVMQYLAKDRSANLDQALAAVSNGKYASNADFLADFGANGLAYISTRMNLTNADTGAIGGFDADGGPVRDARAVVPATGTSNASDGLAGFQVVYPEEGGFSGVRRVQVQASNKAGDLIDMQFSSMNARALGLANLDLTRPTVALLSIDRALEFVGEQRTRNGASSNRLDLAASALQTGSQNLEAARSRIQDTDFASDTAQLTRAQILQQAASAMLAQANGQPRSVLSLLR